MLDLKFVRENPDIVKQNIKNKFQDRKLPLVDEVIELDAKARAVKTEADELRANRNKLSKQIGALMGQGKILKECSENDEISKLLNHPKVSKEDKEHFIEDTFGRVISKEMTGLLVLMIAKDRHKDIVETLNMFMAKVLEYKKIGTAYVKTAVPLSEEQKEKVLKRLLATTDYKEFRMNYSVEPELLGGMIIRINDRVVDSSIKTKLDKLAGDLKKIQLS